MSQLIRAGCASAAAAGLSFAFYATNSHTITASGVFQPFGTTNTDFQTNDAATFDLAAHNISGTDYYGVRFLVEGWYLMLIGGDLQGFTTGDQVYLASFIGGGNYFGPFLNPEQYNLPANPGNPVIGYAAAELCSAGSGFPAPTTPEIWYVKNGTAARGTISADLLYIRLGGATPYP